MAAYVNSNNAFSTLAGNISSADTSFTLAVGSSFPVVVGGNWSFVTFQDLANNIEIMKVTGHADGANSFTCVRAQEGTAARAWIAGDIVECRFTAGTTVTLDGIQTLTNKTFAAPSIRFGDGSLALPGITWQNEPTTGFTRIGANVMAVSVNTANVMQWQPGHTFNMNANFNIPNGGVLNFYNGGSSQLWEVLHANALNTLHVGRIGWTSTTVYGGGAGNVVVHGGGVSLAGSVTGVTAAMVGLGNVADRRQVYELRGGASALYIGWNGTNMDAQVDGTYFGGTWPINISGAAATCSGNAGTASTAANALNICNIGGWRYANAAKNPAYLWASDGNTQDQFLVQPGNLSVGYAASAGTVNQIGSINGATGGYISGQTFIVYNGGWNAPYNGPGTWYYSGLVSQTDGTHNAGISWNQDGQRQWSMVLFDNQFLSGASNAQGPAELWGWAMCVSPVGMVQAKGYQTFGTLRATNATPLTNALAGVLQLRGMRGIDETTQRPTLALLAEDIEKAFPEALGELPSLLEGEPPVVKRKPIDHMALLGSLVEAIRELNERLKLVEAKP